MSFLHRVGFKEEQGTRKTSPHTLGKYRREPGEGKMNSIQSLKSEYGIVKGRHSSMSTEFTSEAGESEFILLLLLN